MATVINFRSGPVRVRLSCLPGALMVGDLVLTPSRQWETVTAVDRENDRWSVRVVTVEAGPSYPWVLVAGRRMHARRLVSSVRAAGVAA